MRRFWSWLALWSGKRAGLVAILGLLITLSLGAGIPRLHFVADQASYLNKSDTVYKDDKRYEQLFGGQAMIVMFEMKAGHRVEHLLSPANRAKMDALSKELQAGAAQHQLVNAISPEEALNFSNTLVTSQYVDGKVVPTTDVTKTIAGAALLRATTVDKSPAGSKARAADTGQTLSRLGAVKGPHTLDNPAWVQFLLYNNSGKIRAALRTFFTDPTHAELIVRLHGNQALDDQSASARWVRQVAEKYQFDGATTLTTGVPALLDNVNSYLKGGMLLLGGIAACVMVLILLVLFDVRWRLLPLGIVAIGLVWAFGLAGYLGIPLTLATIAGLPVMLGVGIDYAIQMHARVEEEVLVSRAEHPIQETARNLCPALLVVTFDAVFAFAALHYAKVPMIREFGLLLAVGIAVICLCSIVGPLAALGIREYKSPTQRTLGRRSRVLAELVRKLGSLPRRAAVPLVVASLAIFAVGILLEPKLVLQTDPAQWVNQQSQVIKDIHRINKGLGSSSELGVFVQADNVYDDALVKHLDEFTVHQLDTNGDGLVTANSVIEVPSDIINDIPNAGHVSPTGAEARATYAAASPDLRRSLVSADGKALNLAFRLGTRQRTSVPLKRTAQIDHDMQQAFRASPLPGSARATPSGLAIVGVGLLHNLEANRVLLTYLAIAFVAAFLALRLRSLVRSLLSLVPVLIAVGTASIVAYVLHLKLSPLTAVGGPLVVAVCTEFTSLLLLRFVEERGLGLSPLESVHRVSERTGKAFIVSGLTAISGVAVISTSSMVLLRDFGLVVGMNVTVALLSALVFLPPMLVWADDEGRNWVSRHLVPEEVLNRHLEEQPAPV